MWGAIASLVMGMFRWLFGGRQQAEGEAQGKAEQSVADLQKELSDVAKADAARGAVDGTPAGVVSDPDNAGPGS